MRLLQPKFFSATLKRLRSTKGIALPVVMAYLMIFAFEIAGLTEYVTGSSRQTKMQISQMRAFYNAETGLEKAVSEIRLYLSKNGTAPTDAAITNMNLNTHRPVFGSNANGGGGSFTNYSLAWASGSWTNKVLTDGDYAGLSGNTRALNISMTARSNGQTQTVTQSVEIQHIPVFQFGVFYQNDLEILPGGTMTFSGPVHSNGNIYLGSDGSTLHFNSKITSYGNIIHGRKDSNATVTGSVYIKDGSGTDRSMQNGDGSWLDSNASNWLLESQNRWGGNVASSVHGTHSLNLPLPSTSQAHTLVERRSGSDNATVQAQKMDYKSNIRIIDGTVTTGAGAALELRYCSAGGTFNPAGGGSCPNGQTVVNPISTTSFYNFREGKTIRSIDLDVSKLRSSPNFVSIQNANNGVIIYSSDHRYDGSGSNQAAIRLTNAGQLPTKGMTLATDNPVYIKGNYNTVNKQPAGIIGDAMNILSNSWSDANSSNSNITSRNASATTVNAAVIAGNKNTTSGNYNGGFENIHRFLENWSGINFTYSGSVAVLFNSQYATGNWIYGSPYYTVPVRTWGYDTSFSDPTYNIPGFPSVYNVARSAWDAS